MGRRSKAGQQDASTVGFDTVGVTILPGRPLPMWAATAAAEALADEPPPAAPEPMAAAPEPVAAAPEPVDAAAAWDAPAPAPGWPAAPDAAGTGVVAPVPAMAMAGAMAASYPRGAEPGYGQPGAGSPGGFAAGGYPVGGYGAGFGAGVAGPSAALQAPTAPAPTAPTAPPGFPAPGGPRDGSVLPGAAAGPAGTASMAAVAAQAPPVPPHPTQAPAAPAAAAPAAPPSAEPTQALAEDAAPAAPSQVWGSEERPQLSPEHVALLTWWAEMIQTGQLPGPVPAAANGATGTQRATGRAARTASSEVERRERRRAMGVAALILGAVVLAATAVLAGPKLVAAVAGEPEPVAAPVTALAMPAGVGELVALPEDTAQAALEPVLGLGLRPSGATVTQAYGTGPDAPMVLAALASTAPAAGDATAQADAWAQRMGATLGESVTGTGTAAGISCTAADGLSGAPAGSVCFWTDPTARGQAYVVGAEPDDALERTAQVRSAITPA